MFSFSFSEEMITDSAKEKKTTKKTVPCKMILKTAEKITSSKLKAEK